MKEVWIILLVEKSKYGSFYHCIVVDSIKGMIIDPAEDKLIRLTEKGLRLCGSGGRKDGEGTEVAKDMEMRVL